MSKADNHSTTITRRAALAGISSSTVIAVAGGAVAAAVAIPADADPLVALWREYFPLATQAHALGNRHDAVLESLPKDLREPRVQVGIYVTSHNIARGDTPRGDPIYAYTEYELDDDRMPVPGGPGSYEQRRAAWIDQMKRELAAAQKAADEARDRAGLPAIEDEMERLSERTGELITAINETAATSPAGYAVKILAAFDWVDADQHVFDYPHIITVSILRDLLPHLPDDIAGIARRFVNADAGAKIDDALYAVDVA